jgi:hypothetical protein
VPDSQVPFRTSNGDALTPYPSMNQAAKMLGVATSTLSRRPDVVTEARGDRDLVLRPAEVLRLGRIYRKRSINETAAELVALAEQHGAGLDVEGECDEFFEQEAKW